MANVHIKLSEREIQNMICEYLAYRHYFFWRQNTTPIYDVRAGRFRSMGKYEKAGAPDIFAIKEGKIYGLEVKSKVGKQNTNQKEFQEGFEKAGGVYHIVRCLEDCQKIGL